MTAAAPAVPSYASGVSDVPLLGDTIGDNLDRMAAAQPDAEAMVEVQTGRRWTYAQLRADVDTVACGLLAAGLGKGDRVGIWAPNVAEWTLVQFATAKIGVILVNINPAYRTHELEFVLNQAGISLLVAATSFKTSDYAAMIERGPAELPAAAPGRADRDAGLGRAGRVRAGRRPRRAGPAAGRAQPGRPDQHPVHLGHHRLPQGRHAVATTTS